jgi:predicted helicase
VAGINLDSRIIWIVDALADLFNCVAVEEIQKEFDKAAQDPYIHFYETFLAEYDPALRETRGVYYTPVPVVKFIVQAVDDILKTEFNLQKGLADYSKIKRTVPGKDGKPETMELHKVQILDPAAGTGTFLAEVIDTIYRYFSKNKGAWLDYCDKHLIPRINGFEILMASYAMAHFKLDMKLKETGYAFKDDSRLRVYLTNSLEEPPKEVPELFMEKWLAEEANEANGIKNNTPVMVVLGNPPYNVDSSNVSDDNYLASYKREPGGIEKLKERNSKMINDDYVKFIRYGQNFIEKYGEGVLAYINNHSFLDNPTFRGMRWNLLNTFDKIYILDLHGNTKKKETAPDGSKDENVFDIMQGVSINIFIKTGKKKENELALIHFYDLFGNRETKYQYLLENDVSSTLWQNLSPETPYYFFVKKTFDYQAEYNAGIDVNSLFPVNSAGIKTSNDNLFVNFEHSALIDNIKNHYNAAAKNDVINSILYRPFDNRYIYFDTNKLGRPRERVMKHFLKNENTGLILGRQGQVVGSMLWNLVFITSQLTDNNIYYRGGGVIYPLYLYPDVNSLAIEEKRRPNLNFAIVQEIISKTSLSFTTEKQNDENTFSPIDILDYIYAVLYSNNYRAKYREFLKIDFPRIPYPENAEQFQKLASIGSLLRSLHLMENISPAMDIADFPVAGTNGVEIINYKTGKVFINKTQYFENIPPEIWGYYIGGHQPAEKWLKDRRGRVLSFEDIEHYQKIITILKTTIELQAQIDEAIEVQNV